MSAPTWPGQSKTNPPDRFIPSAPTLRVPDIADDPMFHRDATPADVRLWLLSNGAEERCGYRFGKAICGLLVAEHPDTWTQWPDDRHDVVSVLVYKPTDSEQLSSDGH